jgi:hypothetical protein
MKSGACEEIEAPDMKQGRVVLEEWKVGGLGSEAG